MFDEVGLEYPPQNYGDMYMLDGAEVEWNWDTFTEVAKRLTIDVNGFNSTEDGFDADQDRSGGLQPAVADSSQLHRLLRSRRCQDLRRRGQGQLHVDDAGQLEGSTALDLRRHVRRAALDGHRPDVRRA